MSNQIKSGYGTFIVAAAAYIVGVLLFAFWSYNAHRTALYGYIDKSLMNAAFTTEEITEEALLKEIDENGADKNPAFIQTKGQLNRIARHGNFSAVAAGIVHQHDIAILISGTNSNDIKNQSIGEHIPMAPGLKGEILRMASGGQHDAALITAAHPSYGAERYAIIFKAINAYSGYVYIAEQERGHTQKQLADQMLRSAAAALGMVVMAIPLITLFSRTQRSVAKNLSQMNSRLQNDMESQKSRESELKEAISDLERFNAVSAGRETRIIELKAEVNNLLEQMGKSKRYNIDKID